MQNAAFRAIGLDAVYLALRPTAAETPAVMALLARNGGGGNVTIPFKEITAAVPASHDARVTQLGAANLFGSRDGALHVGNTDVDGILAALSQLQADGASIGVIGTGGSARAVIGAASELGGRVAVRSRDTRRATAFATWARSIGVEAAPFEQCGVVINATPLGLARGDADPIEQSALPPGAAVLDLTYRGAGTTDWVTRCRERGLRALDGREVLVAQGAASWRLWFPDVDPPLEVMRAAVNGTMD
jgi:shikimate dehydrogenase